VTAAAVVAALDTTFAVAVLTVTAVMSAAAAVVTRDWFKLLWKLQLLWLLGIQHLQLLLWLLWQLFKKDVVAMFVQR
jgi:hypothetical protein